MGQVMCYVLCTVCHLNDWPDVIPQLLATLVS
jgi:hypothetical protein